MEIISRQDAKLKGLTRFFTGVPCVNGHVSERHTKSGSCIECGNKKSREWNVKHNYGAKYRAANQDKLKESARKWRAKNPDKLLAYNLTPYARLISQLNQAKRRAKEKGVEFNLTREDIKIPSHCPVLNIPLQRSVDNQGKKSDNSPSIDRIDNTKGYTKDNIRIISWKANRLKNDATLEELKLIVEYMEKHFESE